MQLAIDLSTQINKQHFSFKASTGEIHGLGVIGASGSGKTTLLRLLSGLQENRQGAITLNGSPGHNPTLRIAQANNDVAFVSQDAALFPHLSIQKNLALASRLSNATAEEDVALMGQTGILPWLEKKPGELSGGQRQRVAITRALLQRPKLLLLDEPFSALDSKSRFDMMQLVLETTRTLDIPFVIVSHHMDEIQAITDETWVVDEYKISLTGSTTQVLQHCELSRFNLEQNRTSVLPFFANLWHESDKLMQLKLINNHNEVTEQICWLPVNPALINQSLELCVAGYDVVVTKNALSHTSFQNGLCGKVDTITETKLGPCVSVDIEGHILKAFISHRAKRMLNLSTGEPVYAYIKAMSSGFEQYR